MKPSTNFKVTVGILLLLLCAVTLYLLVRDFNQQSQRASNPDIGQQILDSNIE